MGGISSAALSILFLRVSVRAPQRLIMDLNFGSQGKYKGHSNGKSDTSNSSLF